MAKSFNQTDRYPAPAYDKQPEQRSKATGGGASPLDPMCAPQPGYSAPQCQTPGDSPKAGDIDHGK